ncbi:hypothetical protein B5X24_HaOG216674 [Helicoverpa armigera]|nr:hypothetical protein B5X24_HaOG216674 [Helicoverpa armigera]
MKDGANGAANYEKRNFSKNGSEITRYEFSTEGSKVQNNLSLRRNASTTCKQLVPNYRKLDKLVNIRMDCLHIHDSPSYVQIVVTDCSAKISNGLFLIALHD